MDVDMHRDAIWLIISVVVALAAVFGVGIGVGIGIAYLVWA